MNSAFLVNVAVFGRLDWNASFRDLSGKSCKQIQLIMVYEANPKEFRFFLNIILLIMKLIQEKSFQLIQTII